MLFDTDSECWIMLTTLSLSMLFQYIRRVTLHDPISRVQTKITFGDWARPCKIIYKWINKFAFSIFLHIYPTFGRLIISDIDSTLNQCHLAPTEKERINSTVLDDTGPSLYWFNSSKAQLQNKLTCWILFLLEWYSSKIWVQGWKEVQ